MSVRSVERPLQSERLEKHQLREDVSTWLAEVLDGEMHSSFDFTYDGADLVAEDGRRMLPVFDAALEHTKQEARINPLLEPEVDRSYAERREYFEILAMARGEGPNTLVSIWEIPDYVVEQGADIGGYRYNLRRAMMRVVRRLPDGTIRMESQSLDSGFRPGFEAIYEYLGQPEPKTGMLYTQPIRCDLDGVQAEKLRENLRDRYDLSLYLKTGKEHTAGRTEEPVVDTYNFVNNQYDLLDAFVDTHAFKRMDQIDEDEYINLAAAMKRRMEGRKVTASDIASEMGGAGDAARENGETFSGCGMTVLSRAGNTAETQLAMLGFGVVKSMSCGLCGGRAMGIDCGPARCLEKNCGSEVRDGKVIDRRKDKQKAAAQKLGSLSFYEYWQDLSRKIAEKEAKKKRIPKAVQKPQGTISIL